MRLFCSTCEKDVTENIAVYENVDGVIVHCGECNYPLMFVGYDEPNWFGNIKELAGSEAVEEQPSLFSENISCSDSCSCNSSACSDCDEDDEKEEVDRFTKRVTFTIEDLEFMQELLIEKASSERYAKRSSFSLFNKVSEILRLRNDK